MHVLVCVLFSLLIHKKYITLTKIFFTSFIVFLLLFYFGGEELQYLIIDTLKFENTSSLGHLIEWIEGILSILENPLRNWIGNEWKCRWS